MLPRLHGTCSSCRLKQEVVLELRAPEIPELFAFLVAVPQHLEDAQIIEHLMVIGAVVPPEGVKDLAYFSLVFGFY